MQLIAKWCSNLFLIRFSNQLQTKYLTLISYKELANCYSGPEGPRARDNLIGYLTLPYFSTSSMLTNFLLTRKVVG